MSHRFRMAVARTAVLIPACWFWAPADASAQSAEARRSRFIEMLLARQDAQAVEMLARQVRRAEARVERLSQVAAGRPRQSAALERILVDARGRLAVLKDPAQVPPLPSRRQLELELRLATEAVDRMNARLEQLVRRGARRMSPREARLYERSLASLRAEVEQAVARRDFLEREAASPTAPAAVASSSLPGL